jgi:hypothetical protein
MMFRHTTLSGLTFAMLVTPVSAAPSRSDVLAACTSPVSSVAATCESVLAAYIAELQAEGVKVDSALGALAYALVTATEFGPSVKDLVALALDRIAVSVGDNTLRASLQAVANDIRDDGRVEMPPTRPYSPMTPSGN